MAADGALRRTTLATTLGLCAAAMAGAPVNLQPGVAVIESRDRQDLRLRLDRDTKVYPAQIQGITVVVRRLVRKVHAPQSWRPFAEEWDENGAAVVLPIHKTGGDLIARLVWEDEKHPVKAGDRVELCRVPDDALNPLILSLRCTGREGDEPVVAPAEVVWIEAQVLSPTGIPPTCEWACDGGQFLNPGGLPAGGELKGPAVIRWRAPALPAESGKATVRLKLTAGPRAQPGERALTLRVARPTKAYARVQWTRMRVPGLNKDSLGPLFGEARQVAAASFGSFVLVDAPSKRLLHWGDGLSARYVPLGGSAVGALQCSGGSAYLVQDSSVLCLKPGATELAKVAALPDVKRLVGLGINAAGDLYVLDSGSPPAIHVHADGQPWRAAPMEPRVDAPWLRTFGVDPRSNDVYVLDARDRVIRQWRALHGSDYRLVDIAIAVGKLIDKHGEPVAVLVRTDRDPHRDLPVQLVFKNGTLTDKWAAEGQPAARAAVRWQPSTTAPPRELVRLRFAAKGGALLPNGDVLLAGEAAAAESKGPVVVQVSARGDFRRMLPLPVEARHASPLLVAAAPDGRRYVILGRKRRRRGSERLIVVGPEGWMLQDLGTLDGYRAVTGLRPDRGSSSHVLIIAETSRRESVFRYDAADPSRCLELSSAGLPGRKIPDHKAVDAASSADRIVVLDRDGKVLVFTGRKPIGYLTKFDTELSKPKAIAILSDVPAAGGKHTYICVLSSARVPSIQLWQIRAADAGKQVVERLGHFPDPERSAPDVQLSTPVAMDSAFPDQPGLLYVLDRGGARLRVFDVGTIAAKLRAKLPPDIQAAAAIDKLPFKAEALDLSVGAGQVVHIADEEGEGIHTYARRQ